MASSRVLVDYPGAGDIPHSPSVRCFDDLVALAMTHMDRPVDVVARSMGGVVAVRAALARPQAVRRLVLAATSGGVDFKAFTHQEWRDEYRRTYPGAAKWITTSRVDLTAELRRLTIPTLLLWSDADEISLIKGGDHMFARDRAAEVAPHIERHLFSSSA